MRTGEEISLAAMKKELVRLSRKADKAKALADDYCRCGSELIAINDEFVEIVRSGATGQEVLRQLEQLKKRKDKCFKILGMDAVTVFDAQHDAERERDILIGEIDRLEYKAAMRLKGVRVLDLS